MHSPTRTRVPTSQGRGFAPKYAAYERRCLQESVRRRCGLCVPLSSSPMEPLPLLVLRHLLAVHVNRPVAPARDADGSDGSRRTHARENVDLDSRLTILHESQIFFTDDLTCGFQDS